MGYNYHNNFVFLVVHLYYMEAFMSKLSVKTHIFILQLIIILVPFLFISFNQYEHSKTIIESKQAQVLELKVEEVGDILHRYNEEVKTYALLIAKMSELQSSVSSLSNEPGWAFNDPSLISNYPHESFDSIEPSAYDERFSKLRRVARLMFTTLHSEHEYIGNIEVMNNDLVVIMRGHRDKRGDSKSDQLIKDAINGVSSSGFLVSKRTGQPAIDGTAPIYSNGKIVGGIKVGMYITEKVTANIEHHTGVHFLSFDKDQLITTSAFIEEVTHTINVEGVNRFDVLSFANDLEENKSITINEDIYKNYIALGLPYTQQYSESDDFNFAVTIIPIKNYKDEIIGAYMVALDNDKVLYDLEQEFRKSLNRIVMIIILAIFVSFIFSYQIGNPLVNFRQQIESMRNKDSIKHIKDISGPQELLDMAFEFNSLIDTVSFQKKKNEKLEIISNIDGLTNLFNHRKFYQDLSLLVKQSEPFSLIFMDLDKFKQINDTLGHSTGDTILREVSKILKVNDENHQIKSYRYGGEEFAVLLTQINKEEAYKISEKIRITIEDSELLQSITEKLEVTISSGIASFPEDAISDSSIVENADFAMYFSKNNGRNKSTLYTPATKTFFTEHSEESIKKNALFNSVNLLSNALEARDKYTGNHSKEVMNYSLILGIKIDMEKSELDSLKYAALLHDNGKIGISDSLLLKKGPLTTLEYEEVKKHPSIGYNIINNLTTNESIKKAILHHHENWNGTGYPSGLEGNKIPLMSRIIAIVDSYQAMTSDRPYRNSMTNDQALQELVDNKSIKYDPLLVESFIEALNENRVNNKLFERNLDYSNDNFSEDVLVNHLLENAYESTKYNIVVLDVNRNIKYVNSSTQALIGKPMEDIINRPCYSTIIGLNKSCKHCKIDNVLANKSIQHHIKHEVTANGISRDIIQIWIPLFDDNNMLKSILEIAIDINGDYSNTILETESVI